MQRKQQVGECWVCVIFFACVCVGTSDMTIVSDDPFSSDLCVVCSMCFPRGIPKGGRYAPLGYAQCSTTCGSPKQCPKICFWAVFAIFRGFVN
jgi:hypothetical protein